MDDNSGDCKFRVTASLHRSRSILDCNNGKGWRLTNEQARNLLDTITHQLRMAEDYYIERLRRWPPLHLPASWCSRPWPSGQAYWPPFVSQHRSHRIADELAAREPTAGLRASAFPTRREALDPRGGAQRDSPTIQSKRPPILRAGCVCISL